MKQSSMKLTVGAALCASILPIHAAQVPQEQKPFEYPGYFRATQTWWLQMIPVPLAVAFDNRSRAIVVSSKQRTARLYDKATNQQSWEYLDCNSGDAGLIFVEGVLYLASRNGNIGRLDQNKNTVQKITSNRSPFFCMAASKNKLFLGAMNDTIVRINRGTDVLAASGSHNFGTYETDYHGSASGWVNALHVVDDTLISGNYTGEIACCNTETGTRTVLGDHNGHPVTAFAHQGNIVYSGANFTCPNNDISEIRMWDIRAAKPLCNNMKNYGTGVHAMVCLPNGYLAVGRDKGMIMLHDMRTFQVAETICTRYGENYGSITALTTTDDGGIISTNSNGLVHVWKEKK